MSGGADTGQALRLEPELTIYSAAALRQTLLGALREQRSLTLDLDDVRELDSAGVQLLVAAGRHAAAQGGKLLLRGHSDAVREAFALFGLDPQGAPASAAANDARPA